MANATIKSQTAEIFKTYGGSEKNTGSIEGQIALMTAKIAHISAHIKSGNKHDHSSNKGLLRLVGQRRKFLAYYAKKDVVAYRELIAKLGLRK